MTFTFFRRSTGSAGVTIGVALLGIAMGLAGCRGAVERTEAPLPTSDDRISLAAPVATAREGAAGAPVDCSIGMTNRSGQTLASAVVACELLDARGAPVGTGLGSLQNVPDGQSRNVRTVVYGVRRFASARAFATSAVFR